MKKNICSILSAAAVCFTFAGCSVPGLEQEEDNNRQLSDSYSYETSSETEDVQNYSWLIEPSIAAENIITFDGSQVDPDNELSTAYKSCSVIFQNGKYGIIDYEGHITVTPAYEDYYTCWCGEIVLYNVIDEKNSQYEYCSADSSGETKNYVSEHYDDSKNYYWDDAGSQIIAVTKGESTGQQYTGKKSVVVGEAEISSNDDGSFNVAAKENSLYGLAKGNELLLEIQFTDFYSPAYKGAGLTCIAFKDSQGKWGYVGSDGKTVIEFKCDGDYSSYGGKIIDSDENSHPYLFTGDYAPISINSTYGYYDIEGNCVVKTSEFEQARPVHNGRAWVKKGGLWGVIQLGEIIEEDTEESSSQAQTTTTTKYTGYYTTYTTSTETSEQTTTSQTETSAETTTSQDTQTQTAYQQTEPETSPTQTSPVQSESETAQQTQQTFPQTPPTQPTPEQTQPTQAQIQQPAASEQAFE